MTGGCIIFPPAGAKCRTPFYVPLARVRALSGVLVTMFLHGARVHAVPFSLAPEPGDPIH